MKHVDGPWGLMAVAVLAVALKQCSVVVTSEWDTTWIEAARSVVERVMGSRQDAAEQIREYTHKPAQADEKPGEPD